VVGVVELLLLVRNLDIIRMKLLDNCLLPLLGHGQLRCPNELVQAGVARRDLSRDVSD